MIVRRVKGDLKRTLLFLNKVKSSGIKKFLENIAQKGVEELYKATPKDTGKTANSWSYEIKKTSNGYTITWINDNFSGEVPIALLIQYGHATIYGSYVDGRDYINPALKPIFDNILIELNNFTFK